MPVCARVGLDEANWMAWLKSHASTRGKRVVFRLLTQFGRLFASRPTPGRGVRRIAHPCGGRLADGPESPFG
jgi:hypothetical protein